MISVLPCSWLFITNERLPCFVKYAGSSLSKAFGVYCLVCRFKPSEAISVCCLGTLTSISFTVFSVDGDFARVFLAITIFASDFSRLFSPVDDFISFE